MQEQLRTRLGRRIRDLRTEREWSQEDLADASGLHRNYIGAGERGERNLTIGSLQMLAGAFGMTLSELLKDVDRGLRPDREKALAKIERRRAKIPE